MFGGLASREYVRDGPADPFEGRTGTPSPELVGICSDRYKGGPAEGSVVRLESIREVERRAGGPTCRRYTPDVLPVMKKFPWFHQAWTFARLRFVEEKTRWGGEGSPRLAQ